MGEIIRLKTSADAERETVMEVLEELMGLAKENKIDALGVAVVMGANISASFSETSEGPRLLGAATLLQSRVISAMEDSHDEANGDE
jgi:hypothetical protein